MHPVVVLAASIALTAALFIGAALIAAAPVPVP